MARPKKTETIDADTLATAPNAQPIVPLQPVTVDLCRPDLFGLSIDYIASSDIPRYKIGRSKVLVRIANAP